MNLILAALLFGILTNVFVLSETLIVVQDLSNGGSTWGAPLLNFLSRGSAPGAPFGVLDDKLLGPGMVKLGWLPPV